MSKPTIFLTLPYLGEYSCVKDQQSLFFAHKLRGPLDFRSARALPDWEEQSGFLRAAAFALKISAALIPAFPFPYPAGRPGEAEGRIAFHR